jgi:hypothetical protein
MSCCARLLCPAVRARLTVLTAAFGLVSALLVLGLAPFTAIWVTVAATAGAVEVSCRLTAPCIAPRPRITVVVVILVFIVRLLSAGLAPLPSLVLVIVGAFVLTEIARRLTGIPYRLPRIVY